MNVTRTREHSIQHTRHEQRLAKRSVNTRRNTEEQKRMQNEADDGHKGHDWDVFWLVMIDIVITSQPRHHFDGRRCPVTTTDGMASRI